jgi:hypothetical protein
MYSISQVSWKGFFFVSGPLCPLFNFANYIAVFFVPCEIGGLVEHKIWVVEGVKAVEFVDYAAVARAISRRASENVHCLLFIMQLLGM